MVSPELPPGITRNYRRNCPPELPYHDDNLISDLWRFHRYFASGWHDDPKEWPFGYDRLRLSSFSPYVAYPLAKPNDALSKPNNIQNIARVLVSLGWHPRAVAGLIRSRFERDFGWGMA